MRKPRLVREAIEEGEDWELQLPVSMIDVTFLILIFFLCTAKFKALEQRLDATLPKEDGLTTIRKRVEKVEEIRVRISLKSKSRPSGGVRILVNRLPVDGLRGLARKLAEVRAVLSGVPVVIDGRQDVPFQWILGAVDACALAKIDDVRFQAPPAEGAGGGKWWYE